jgi:hypothetical protein
MRDLHKVLATGIMQTMGKLISSARRWLKSTSNRTFVAWPLLLLAMQALIDGGAQQLNWWALPLLIWGYGQYRFVGAYRSRLGGGGPGMSVPPERLVSVGPYGLVRNPMYLGHIIFFLGLALMFSGAAWLVFAAHVVWFDRRARADEQHLIQVFGAPYREYTHRVKRWIPWVY